MLESRISELAKGLIKVRLDENIEQAIKDIDKKKSQLAAKSLLSSSVCVRSVREICIKSLNSCGEIVWGNLERVIEEAGIGIDNGLTKDLKDEFLKYMTPILERLNQTLNSNVRHCTTREQSLEEDFKRLNDKINAEIDLYVESLKRKDVSAGSSDTTTIIAGSYVGVVQTGAGSTANVIQNISSGDKQKILNALDEIKQYLENHNEMMDFTKEEVLDWIELGEKEIKKSNTNLTRLKVWLGNISLAINTVSALNSAYIVLHGVLS